MKKIGILGGTFNPIHNGHLSIADLAYHALSLDEVMFIPTGISYLKAGTKVLDKEHRLRMTELAVADTSYFSCSDIEIRRDGNTYTKDTLIQLREQCEDSWFYFIGGSDTLFGIEKWYEPQTIFDNCSLVILNRDEYLYEQLEEKRQELISRFHADIYVINSQKIDISSTMIRNMFKDGNISDVEKLLPEKVFNYIVSNNLF